MVERLWAGWRVPAMMSDRHACESGDHARAGSAGLELVAGRTLFEAILESGMPDEQTHVVWRGQRVFVLLNRYPYSTGHLLVVPCRAAAELEELDADERRELWDAVHDAVAAVKSAFKPDGVNVGANLGDGAGPSIPDHLHVHVLPRWRSDTNFMSAVADVRVLPLTLQECWELLVAAWPSQDGAGRGQSAPRPRDD